MAYNFDWKNNENLKTDLDGGWERGGMDHVSQRKKKPFHDSRVLKKQFHGKLDSNKII
jgi:hypothetical protein